MRILHVINSLATGGAERLVSELLPVFNKEKGMVADLYILNNTESIYLDKLEKADIKIYYSQKKSIYNPLHIFSLLGIMKKYDIIHSHLFPSQYWVALAKIFLKNKILVTTEHSTYNRRRKHKLFNYLDKYIYGRYDKIISISEQTNEELNKWVKLPRSRCTVISNGVNIKDFADALPYDKKQLGFQDGDFLVTMIARFDYQKDQETCIKSLNYTDKNVKFIFIGEGPNLTKCKEMVMEMNLESRSIFLGVRKDVASLLKMSDLCVLSSHWEGFGLVSVEYMAASKPVIVSAVPGLKEVVENYGLLFNPGDPYDLAIKINLLKNSKEKYSSILIKCTQRANEFNITFTCENYLKLYRLLAKVN